jgi:plastocyanin
MNITRAFSVRRYVSTLCLAGLAVLGLPSPAHAVVAAAGPGSFAGSYATPVVFTQSGGPVTFVNGDVAPHTMTAADAYLPKKIAKKTRRCSGYSPRSCPLFATKTVDSGESAELGGLKRLKPGGQYAFRCMIHSNMRGTLVVAP